MYVSPAHVNHEVVEAFEQIGTEVIQIFYWDSAHNEHQVEFNVNGYTSKLQTLDVGIKKSFKDYWRQWQASFIIANPSNCKPSRQIITKWASETWNKVTKESIINTWNHIGIKISREDVWFIYSRIWMVSNTTYEATPQFLASFRLLCEFCDSEIISTTWANLSMNRDRMRWQLRGKKPILHVWLPPTTNTATTSSSIPSSAESVITKYVTHLSLTFNNCWLETNKRSFGNGDAAIFTMVKTSASIRSSSKPNYNDVGSHCNRIHSSRRISVNARNINVRRSGYLVGVVISLGYTVSRQEQLSPVLKKTLFFCCGLRKVKVTTVRKVLHRQIVSVLIRQLEDAPEAAPYNFSIISRMSICERYFFTAFSTCSGVSLSFLSFGR